MKLLRGLALLGQDALGRGNCLRVARALSDATQQLVGTDLQVLERVGEPGELGRRVRLGGEEATPVERAEPQSLRP